MTSSTGRLLTIGSLLMTSSMASTVTCKTAGGQWTEVHQSWINDGYCDCWETGQDETRTDACAGVDHWGWAMLDVQKGADDMERPYFMCQQREPDMAPLAVSRVQDGICDCCDGSDETATSVAIPCPDTCAELHAAALAERAEMAHRYAQGSVLRQEAIRAYQTFKTESLLELETLQTQVTMEETNLEALLADLASVKRDFANQRLDRIAQSTANDDEILGLLTNDEWKQLIIHSCQLSGEMSAEGSVCEALQLAVLDAGLLLKLEEESTFSQEELVDIIYYNANHPEDRIWKVEDLPTKMPNKKKNKGRRTNAPEEYPDDTDDYGDHFDLLDGASDSSENDDKVKNGEQITIAQLPFSESRVGFLAKASRLLKLIDESSKLRKGETTSGEQIISLDEDELKRRGTVKELVAMEDKEFDLLKAYLTTRKRLIRRGFDFALSGVTTLDKIDDATTLQRVALGIVYYGKLSAMHVYQILAAILRFGIDGADDAQSCVNIFAQMCPPKTVVRGNHTIPSKIVVEAVESFCKGVDLFAAQASCIDVDAVPKTISDGFAGYYEVLPPTEDDPCQILLEKTFALSSQESARLLAIGEKEGSVEASRKKLKELEKRIKDLNQAIGTGDEGKYGPDGELHSIRDECFSVKAGKYTYELCMYQKAAQKDGESSSNLGNWAGASVETIEDREEHVWRWDGGAKCWNGPKRSATAHVTCGIKTVVLSAEEPDTCRYVFQVQSPMACDEAFRTRYGL